jgi:hypothetical protein
MNETTANNLIDTPINNLALLIGILGLLIVIGIGVLISKFGPMLYRLFKEQADTTARLTTLAEQNKVQSQVTITSIAENTVELKEQTAAIKLQGLDFRNYQTLVSDTMSDNSERMAQTTAEIKILRISIESLGQQIKDMLDDPPLCAHVEELFKTLKNEVLELIVAHQIKRATQEAKPVSGEKPTS